LVWGALSIRAIQQARKRDIASIARLSLRQIEERARKRIAPVADQNV
jgi:hypothetical protein